jgi:hypothetical protein
VFGPESPESVTVSVVALATSAGTTTSPAPMAAVLAAAVARRHRLDPAISDIMAFGVGEARAGE